VGGVVSAKVKSAHHYAGPKVPIARALPEREIDELDFS
jgi:hypothetical protein